MKDLEDLLRQITETGIGKCTDYQFNDRNHLNLSLAGPFEPELTPIAGNKAGCIVACYQHIPGTPLNDQPIVWLDSEGYPNGIFAQNLNEFFGLIPYGSGWVYEMLSASLRAFDESKHSGSFKLPVATNPSPCSCPEVAVFLRWLQVQKHSVVRNPVQVILNAFLINPSFQDELSQFFSEK